MSIVWILKQVLGKTITIKEGESICKYTGLNPHFRCIHTGSVSYKDKCIDHDTPDCLVSIQNLMYTIKKLEDELRKRTKQLEARGMPASQYEYDKSLYYHHMYPKMYISPATSDQQSQASRAIEQARQALQRASEE